MTALARCRGGTWTGSLNRLCPQHGGDDRVRWSLGGGYQATPWRGFQGVGNASGLVSGPTAGVLGMSGALTWGKCF
jgi:hypothetical protein